MRRISPIVYFSIVVPFTVAAATLFLLQMDIHIAYAYLGSACVVMFLLYGYDKRQSLSSSLRVPEVMLHGLALLGGSPGALVGQMVFRHKTKKLKFQIVFWIIVVIQVIAVVIFWEEIFKGE